MPEPVAVPLPVVPEAPSELDEAPIEDAPMEEEPIEAPLEAPSELPDPDAPSDEPLDEPIEDEPGDEPSLSRCTFSWLLMLDTPMQPSTRSSAA